ncbi:MAG: ModD protein [Spirochaetota bacterium]
MFNFIQDSEIDRFIEEDMPYGDLTTHLLGIGEKKGEIVFSSREETILCCTEEAGRLFEKLGAKVTLMLASGTTVPPNTEFLRAMGSAQALHAGWKSALNLLEYASGISSRTGRIVAAARAMNSSVMIASTRKLFPGTKKIAIKAVMAGGALPHRLGLSETILVFKHHAVFMGGLDEFLKTVPELHSSVKETKIVVEADNSEEALKIASSGTDIVQIDKMKPAELSMLVKKIRAIAPEVKISAAGGINESNAAEYAATGVDILVLSSVYFGKPADVNVRIIPIKE